ncbi:hypothetical protein A9Q98_11515 [Thalassotalea sp. 42_200_T64]|nr:hypothetical protein A9Q98_11515 [Thalassotalea sp. 42_200_T64]
MNNNTEMNSNTKMKSKLSAIALATALVITMAPLAHAQSAEQTKPSKNVIEQIEDIPTEEKVGLSIGAIIGGIFGGPPGAFITALAGDFIGKHMVAEQEIIALEHTVDKQQRTASNNENRHQGEIKNLEIQYQQEMMSIANAYENSEKAQVENILVSLMFRTGSSDIEPHYQQQVIALAKVLQRSPHLNIDLSGFTDKQGEEQLNLVIAEQRVNKVKDLLIMQGVTEQRIITSAFGELAPIDQNVASEVNYFDRRVEMKLIVNSEEVAKQAKL